MNATLVFKRLLGARTRRAAESDHCEHDGAVVFKRFTVTCGFCLADGEKHTVPFAVTLPWETRSPSCADSRSASSSGRTPRPGVADTKKKNGLEPLSVCPMPFRRHLGSSAPALSPPTSSTRTRWNGPSAALLRLAKKILALDAGLSDNTNRAGELLDASPAANLLQETGIGPVTAATALGRWSHPGRSVTKPLSPPSLT